MNTCTVNISFQDTLLTKIDRIAAKESRSRSELLREAARIYIERKNKWDKIFSYGRSKARNGSLSENEVMEEIHKHRTEKHRHK